MPKKFAFSDDGSRYHTLKYHNRRFWGRPVYKAVVDAGFTCPNIDGSCGVGGCVYCSGGSGYFTAWSFPCGSRSFARLSVSMRFTRKRG
ncbi:MAG: hypothetical protein ACLSG5_02425 [Oscillospiraceae bacterium]